MRRPPMPEGVKRAAIIRQTGYTLCCAETGKPISAEDAINGRIHFDHRPPLALRAYDKDAGVYKPDANDVTFIDVCSVEGHKKRTNEARGLQRSDQSEIAHGRRLRKKNEEHRARMAAKAPRVQTERQKAAKAYRKRRYQEAKAWKKANQSGGRGQ